MVALALAGVGAWRLLLSKGTTPGYAQLTAAPWAEVVSIQSKEGKNLNIQGQTPLSLELPPGEYIVELKTEQAVGKVTVVVRPGEVSHAHYTPPAVNVKAIVDELVSKY